MLVKLKEPYPCDQCGEVVKPNDKDNHLHKTKFGAMICQKCQDDESKDTEFESWDT